MGTVNKPEAVISEYWLCALLLFLTGCYDAGDHRWCGGDNINDAVALDRCSKDKTCVLSGKEYAWMADMRREFPQCFHQGVKQ